MLKSNEKKNNIEGSFKQFLDADGLSGKESEKSEQEPREDEK